jgi:hypothetical protein
LRYKCLFNREINLVFPFSERSITPHCKDPSPKLIRDYFRAINSNAATLFQLAMKKEHAPLCAVLAYLVVPISPESQLNVAAAAATASNAQRAVAFVMPSSK